jgi:hypothetical protein
MDDAQKWISQLKTNDKTWEDYSSSRAFAAEKLGELKEASAVPELIDLLKDRDRFLASQVAVALGMIGDERAIPALILQLYGEERVCEKASEALGKFSSKSVIPALLGALGYGTELYKETYAIIRRFGFQAVPTLMAGLKDGNRHMPFITSMLIELLNNYCTLEQVKEFGKILNEKYEIIQGTGSEISSDLRSEFVELRRRYAIALVKSKDPSAVPLLVEELENKEKDKYAIVIPLEQALKDCKSAADIREFEDGLKVGVGVVKKRFGKDRVAEVQFIVLQFMLRAAKKKDELAQDKGILLTDIPKPPKKGGIYRLRKVMVR